MATKWREFDYDYEVYDYFKELCPDDSYRVIELSKLSGYLPDDIINNAGPKAIMMSTAGPGGGITGVAFQWERADLKSGYLDQDAMVFLFNHEEWEVRAGMPLHGDWAERSFPIPKPLLQQYEDAGIVDYAPITKIPVKTEGHKDELPIDKSVKAAYWKGRHWMDRIKGFIRRRINRRSLNEREK